MINKSAEQETNIRKLSTKTKILFGLGDIYGGGGFQLIGFLYAIFLSDTVGLNMNLIPIVVLIGKIWDASIDPVMGRITDNTKTRWGRRRPYFLFGSVGVVLSYVFLFSFIPSDSQMFLLGYALVGYLTFSTVWSSIMVPYFAFNSEITLDYNERTRVVSFRMFFSLVGSLLAAALPMLIIHSFSSSRQGYLVMSLAFGVLFGLSVLSVFFSAKETKRTDLHPENIGFFQSFVNVLKISSFRKYIGMFIFGMMGVDIVSMAMAYYTRYYLRADGVLSTFLTVALVTQLVMLPFWSFIAKKFSKKTVYLSGALIWCVMGIILVTMPKGMTVPVILLLIIFISSGMGAVMFIPHCILGDITDIGEFAYGKRQEGAFAGYASFIRQLSGGISLALATGLLGLVGYITPPDGTVNFTEVYQPPIVETTIKILISVVPVVMVLIGSWFAVRYHVTRENHNKIITHLNHIREGGEGTMSAEEELHLRRLLISKNNILNMEERH